MSAEKFLGAGQRKKKDRKIAPLNLPSLYFISIMYKNLEEPCPLPDAYAN